MHTEQFAGRWLRAELLSRLPLFLPLTGTAPCPAPTRPAVPSLPASAGKSWGSSQALGPPQACPQSHPQQLHLLRPRKGPPYLLGRSLCLQLPVSPTPNTRQAEWGWGRGVQALSPMSGQSSSGCCLSSLPGSGHHGAAPRWASRQHPWAPVSFDGAVSPPEPGQDFF